MSNYLKSPRGCWVVQKSNAKRRGIPWELSFEDWWEIWEQSGKWKERGRKADDYVMSRKQDIGGYAKDNVVIIKSKNNSAESFNHSLRYYIPKKKDNIIRVVKKQQEVIDHWEISTELAQKWGTLKIYSLT